ncbi:MRG family protein [Giardia muris]|uniref:MRG family protein n=1 Tax=Giardia muris TaxID=5742 RepID=A0A4Z1SXR4_GIAMU|nr:MRG family protein [Giardia muris]|eukprot:TNJ30486.1 MRG family protein [Giardia muris]
MEPGDHALFLANGAWYHVFVEDIEEEGLASVRWYGHDRLFEVPITDLKLFTFEAVCEHRIVYTKISRKFLSRLIKGGEYSSGGKLWILSGGKTCLASEVVTKLPNTLHEHFFCEDCVDTYFIRPGEITSEVPSLCSKYFTCESMAREKSVTSTRLEDSHKVMRVLESTSNTKSNLLVPIEVSLAVIQRNAARRQLVLDHMHSECNGADLLPLELLRRATFTEYMIRTKGMVIGLPQRPNINDILEQFRTDPLENTSLTSTKLQLRQLFEIFLLGELQHLLENGGLFFPMEAELILSTLDPTTLKESAANVLGADFLIRVVMLLPAILRSMNTDTNYLMGRALLLVEFLHERQHYFAERQNYVSPKISTLCPSPGSYNASRPVSQNPPHTST